MNTISEKIEKQYAFSKGFKAGQIKGFLIGYMVALLVSSALFYFLILNDY